MRTFTAVIERDQEIGFIEVRQRGLHRQFRHPDGRGTTCRVMVDATLLPC